MAKENTTFLTRCCPHCGFKLTFGFNEAKVECPKCFTEVGIEHADKNEEKNTNIVMNDNSSSIAIVSGSNTNPESIIIFLEDYFAVDDREDYEDFGEIGTKPINKLIDQLKLTHGNEKLTWKAAVLSYIRGSQARFNLLDKAKESIVEAINNEDEEETIRLFEDYVINSKALNETKERLFVEIERGLKHFEDQGASNNEIASLKSEVDQLKEKFAPLDNISENLEDIPEIAKAKEAIDKKIEMRFEEQGVVANELYSQAIEAEGAGNLSQALLYFGKLGDYKDSKKHVEKMNKCLMFDDLLVVNDKYYAFKEHEEEIITNKRKAKIAEKEEQQNERHLDNYDIVATKLSEDGNYEVSDEVLINNYQKWLNTFGDTFYYISKRGTIHAYDLVKKIDNELETTARHRENEFYMTYDNGTKGLLLSNMKVEGRSEKDQAKIDKKKEKTSDDLEPTNYNKKRIDILNYGRNELFFELLVDHIHEVVPFANGKYMNDDFIRVVRYEFEERKVSKKVKNVYKTKHVILVNVKTKQQYEDIVDINENIVHISDNNIYFNRFAPSKYNISLIKMNLETKEEQVLLTNIYTVERIENEKIFYTVGNTEKRDFYYYNVETGEKHLVLERYNGYEQYDSGYFYLYRGKRNNKTMFKIKEDGSQIIVLAMNVNDTDKYAYSRKVGGYFYYQNIFDELCCVRIDGEHHQIIAKDIFQVLRANDKEIIYSTWETSDQLFGKVRKDAYRYKRSCSIYRYDPKKETNEKLLFGLEKWHYYRNDDSLYYQRINEETYITTNLKKKDQFSYNTIQKDYYVTKLDNIEEKKILTYGLPHMEKKRGCFIIRIFRRKKDNSIKFEKCPWQRPYLKDKEELFR